jgi:hypothetical protein
MAPIQVDAMTAIRLVSGTLLAGIWGVIAWVLLHRRQIRTTVERNDAMPRPTPKRNFLFLLALVAGALTCLLIYMMK